MILDLDELTKTLPPWDLSITLKGRSYKIRQLTVKDLQDLEGAGNAEGAGRLAEVLAGLLEGKPRPDAKSWGTDTLQAILAVVQTYAAKRGGENAGLMRQAIQAARESQAKPAA